VSGGFMRLTCTFLVELPGIEPGPNIGLSCTNAGFCYAKRRGSAQNDLRIRQKR
jgi:hypothetical protein